MTRIILVRHCEAEGNTNGVFQGHSDCDISGSGQTQLDLLGVRCRNMPIDAIYSSPLKRAYKTAEAINRYHGLEIRLDARLKEINCGDFEGLAWDELPSIYPEEMDIWNKRPYDFTPSGGETMREVYKRMWECVTDIVKENPGKTICVASHGCSIRNFLCHALNKPIELINQVGWCDNTGISLIDFDEELNSNVVMMNDASHLTPETSIFMNQTWWLPQE
jgi:probable phosphoglycerate mutase